MVNNNPGATRSRDPAAARRRILDAATAEFAARGFAGARVDRIAATAGLNKRMLYHYFDDKRGLHRAVLERLLPNPDSGAALVPDAGSARLLLWSLLEPETAAETAARLPAAGAPAGDDAATAVIVAVAARLLAGRPPPARLKPRVRLRHRPGR